MEPQLAFARTFARLIGLLRHRGSTIDEVKETLRFCVAHSRERTITFRLDDWKFSIDDEVVPATGTGCEEISGQLHAHGVAELTIRQFASAPELIKLVRLLAEPGDDDPQAFAQRALAAKLWNVDVTPRGVGQAVPAEASEPTPDDIKVAHHLARIRQVEVPLDASLALQELTEFAQELVEAGNAEAVAELLVGLWRAEQEASEGGVRITCRRAIEKLARPVLTRLVAQLLPGLLAAGRQKDYADHRDALGRCGAPGAAALLAHLMAADSFEERRVFYNAIVELRCGIPMLIDALGHPQWYIVRNAASLLGEMREPQADQALARLLEHRDERVREAAAAALSRIDTATARIALQRMLQDRSPHVRLHAAGAFATSPAKTATPLATALEVESDADVQLGIIHALGRLGTPDAVRKLVRAVMPSNLRPRPVSFRIAALEALTAARGPSAMPTLRSLVQDSEPAVRDAAERLIATVALAS
jgi:HEAT repeat protein